MYDQATGRATDFDFRVMFSTSTRPGPAGGRTASEPYAPRNLYTGQPDGPSRGSDTMDFLKSVRAPRRPGPGGVRG